MEGLGGSSKSRGIRGWGGCRGDEAEKKSGLALEGGTLKSFRWLPWVQGSKQFQGVAEGGGD